ncbi:hypothetical protein BDD12DRAFT_406979 [Trichophaea hybrida]|nr:hypothetical protein BDD12DRAFT_406979 [Trichophaea hybrida]
MAAQPPISLVSEKPPDLQAWRDRLFHVAETIVMTEADWNTYWPHIDNVWSHRSTQVSKNGPIKTHYYDCRLKGRPPGAAPSLNNPNRKKRKRVARERNLCDMKIKVTEAVVVKYVGDGSENPVPVTTYTVERVRREVLHRATPGGGYIVEKLDRDQLMVEHQRVVSGSESRAYDPQQQQQQQQLEDGVNGLSMGVQGPPPLPPPPIVGWDSGDVQPSYNDDGTFGSGVTVDLNLDSYGVPGLLGEVHRHTLAHSDSIKKCTVQRELLKKTKELKKQQTVSADLCGQGY